MISAVGAVLFFGLGAQAAEVENDDAVRKSVVRVFVTQRGPDYRQPWQMGPQTSASGSGCILKGNRILTNAHVIGDGVFIQVRKADDARKYDAKVEFMARDSELALLRVDDPGFFKDTRAVELGELPRQRDKVAAYGFPAGGEDLSITEGIVSRIEVTPYAFSDRDLLTIQTDAAVNPGNSGGALVKDGRLVGISFQMYGEEGVERTNYAVPSPIIERFLKDVANGKYEGVPEAGFQWEGLENESLREFYGLKSGQNGILVRQTAFGSPAFGALRRGDVVTAINGVEIAGDGTYAFRRGQRLLFTHLFNMLQMGDRAAVELIRDGKPAKVELRMKPFKKLVDGSIGDDKPGYYIFAGLVFMPLTNRYFQQWKPEEAPLQLTVTADLGAASDKRRQAVVLSHVLPHEINRGYHDIDNLVIESVNGVRVGDMAQLISAFKKPEGRYHVIVTDPLTDFGGRKIVLDARKAEPAQREILSSYGIPQDRSADLK